MINADSNSTRFSNFKVNVSIINEYSQMVQGAIEYNWHILGHGTDLHG